MIAPGQIISRSHGAPENELGMLVVNRAGGDGVRSDFGRQGVKAKILGEALGYHFDRIERSKVRRGISGRLDRRGCGDGGTQVGRKGPFG